MRYLFVKVYRWLFEEPWLTVTIEGNGNRVTQKNCVSGGDIVGGNLYREGVKDTHSCPHCGGPI